MLFRKVFISIVLILLFSVNAHAVNPDEVLKDPILEERARNLSKEIRCMVCQNQSIDNSDASVAKDLRLLIRERIVAGDSDAQVLNYLVGRFGEFVLLKPRFSGANLVLWATPILALLFGIYLFVAIIRRSKMLSKIQSGAENNQNPISSEVSLSKKEKSEITKILSESD